MDLAAAVAPTTLARQRTLPVADPLIPLLPDGALTRVAAVACGGIAATSLAVALAADATAAGAWLAVVDVPWLGVEAAAELGVPLERLVRVDLGDAQCVSEPRGASAGLQAATQITVLNVQRGAGGLARLEEPITWPATRLSGGDALAVRASKNSGATSRW